MKGWAGTRRRGRSTPRSTGVESVNRLPVSLANTNTISRQEVSFGTPQAGRRRAQTAQRPHPTETRAVDTSAG